MPETTSQTANPRVAIREARERRLQLVAKDHQATVKVFAANETLREVLRHPNGTRFRETLGEAVEWPNDSFTARRIADGSVRTDGPGSGEMAEPDPSKNAREQAAARRPKAEAQKAAEPAAPKSAPPKPTPPAS